VPENQRRQYAILACALAMLLMVLGWQFLGGQRPPSTEDLVATALGDGTVKQRQYAAVKLGERGKSARQQILVVLDQSKQPEVRVACIQSLTEQWDYRSMPLFFDLLNDPSAAVRLQAGETVGHLLRWDYEFRKVNGDNQQKDRQAVVEMMRSDWERFKRDRLCQTYIREKLGEDL
jgi:hypothetical protein